MWPSSPGDAFGASGEGYARVSYAYWVEHLMEALSEPHPGVFEGKTASSRN